MDNKEIKPKAIQLAFEIPSEECPTFVEAVVYADDDYGYYDRTATYFSDTYEGLLRFNRSEFPKIIQYVNDHRYDLVGIEKFISTLDGYERVR